MKPVLAALTLSLCLLVADAPPPALADTGTATHAIRAAPLAVGPPTSLPTASVPSGGVAEVAADYRLDVDDTVSVSVTRHGDVGGTFHVPPDGIIRLQRVVTPIDVRGKTTTEVTDEITRKLTAEGKLVLHPGQVTVTVVSTRMRRIFVRGNAVKGTEIDLKNGWRIDDLVSVLGGVQTPDRVTTRVTNPLRPAPVAIDLDAALRNPNVPDNLLLQEGDTLTVDLPQMKRLMIKGEGPRGMHEIDERFGLRNALVGLGYSTNGATGDVHRARIIRNAKPGDSLSATTYIPVDLGTLLSQDSAPDVPFQDLDTLEIPKSEQYIYVFGEIGGPRTWYLPQDRKTFLVDVYSNAGGVTNNAKMGNVKVFRQSAAGVWKPQAYDLGRFLKTADARDNPEILPHDMVVVPQNNRVDVVSNIGTGFFLLNIFKTLIPGLRIP